MRVLSKRVVHTDEVVYDVVGATPNDNFLVSTLSNKCIVSHNCGLLDEVDFHKGADANMLQSKVMKIYRGVKRRMESRYLKKGKLPGILFIVSSKKSEHDFIEKYAETQRDNPTMLMVDEPLWKVKPPSNYGGETFKLAVGNKIVKSHILSETDDPNYFIQQGYTQIIDVPVEHKQAFELDIDSALMDIAGISSTSKSKFISIQRLRENYTMRKNPFRMEVLVIGLDDDLEIKDFFIPKLVRESDKAKPGFIHIDTSVTGDVTGLSLVVLNGTKTVNQYRKGGHVDENQLDMIYKQIFSVGIKAPSDSEISFEKTRQFVYYLSSIGFNIQGVSADGFQSRDTIQQFTVAGYNAKTISLDRTPDGYMTAKASVNETRLNLLDLTNTKLEKELTEVEQDGLTGKIDHPPIEEGGSKDIADSLVGSIAHASKYKQNLQTKHAASDGKVLSDLMNTNNVASDPAQSSAMLGVDTNNVVNDISDMINHNSNDDIIDWI